MTDQFFKNVGRQMLTVLAMTLLVARGGTPGRADDTVQSGPEDRPFRVVVMDPLAKQLACDCVAGYAQRDYSKFAEHLQQILGRRVETAYAEALSSPLIGAWQEIDLVIGKFSLVAFDARKRGLPIRPVAMLSGEDGAVTQTGLFVVRREDPARSIEDLEGYKFLFGEADSDEKRSAAFATLEAFDVPLPSQVESKSACSTAALAVVEADADAAVVSSYAMPLLKGCGTIEAGELRIVSTTDPVPFIGVFATDRVSERTERGLIAALMKVREDPALLTALESRDGFVKLPAIQAGHGEGIRGWDDWRGPGRDGLSRHVPADLPEKKRLLWSRTLTGPGMSGLAVADGYVVVADKNLDETDDIFHCLDADIGREIWRISYPAKGDMDFTNSPRANPVIRGELVYLLGAFGDLYCARLATGEVVWKKQLARDFGAKRPMWGYCSTPLVVGEKLVVNPGAQDAALVALNRHDGTVLWRTAGDPPGYGSFILAKLGGVQQVVGHDVASLGGWDPETGERLWRLVPEFEGDFNVPTPITLDGKILVATENNGARLYGFDRQGHILPEPLAINEDMVPDMSTPVVLEGLVFGNCNGLMCLNLDDGLKTLWEADRDDLAEYCAFIAGNGHVLIFSESGKVLLVKADKRKLDCVAELALFDDVHSEDREVWSHPALVGNRLYIRNLLGVYCFLLD